jgi:4-diphosphocytidyl-2-C-methyl-D-erythritol kinase
VRHDPGFAPAKVNLALHVTGRRADGYHLLDSLVVFVSVGDRLAVAPDEGLSLEITGPEASGLEAGPDNLVMRAAAAFGTGVPGARLRLEKNLPVAAGIGGGSADAAAALRLLARAWSRPLPPTATILGLGADVPVCLAGIPARMRGIGEAVAPLPHPLPPLWLVLVNPRAGLPTASVFAALETRESAPMPDVLPRWRGAAELARWLGGMRNDLEPPARRVAPVVGAILGRIAELPGCLLARMSGSGATCFGLFADEVAAAAAARAISRAEPGWWVAAAEVLPA